MTLLRETHRGPPVGVPEVSTPVAGSRDGGESSEGVDPQDPLPSRGGL